MFIFFVLFLVEIAVCYWLSLLLFHHRKPEGPVFNKGGGGGGGAWVIKPNIEFFIAAPMKRPLFSIRPHLHVENL
jgi:hypothetical protein